MAGFAENLDSFYPGINALALLKIQLHLGYRPNWPRPENMLLNQRRGRNDPYSQAARSPSNGPGLHRSSAPDGLSHPRRHERSDATRCRAGWSRARSVFKLAAARRSAMRVTRPMRWPTTMAVQMWSPSPSVERPMPGIGLVGLIGFAAGHVAVDAAQMIGDAQSSFSNSVVRQTDLGHLTT